MSARSVRRIVIAVCVAGIAGMIVSSIRDNNGAALTSGLVTAVSVLCLIVATAVTGAGRGVAGDPVVESLAAAVEEEVQALVDAGADEQAVRRLVGASVRLGRSSR